MRIAHQIRQIGLAAVFISGQALAAAPTRVDATPFCIVNEAGVLAQSIVETQRRDSSGPPKLTSLRYFWRVECSRQTGQCEAIRFNLQNIEAGTPIGVLDVILPKNMRLTSIDGRVARIVREPGGSGVSFSPGFAIMIDLDRKRFEVTSSGELGQSIGVGSCLSP